MTACSAAVLVAGVQYSISGRRSQVFGRSVCRGSGDRRTIALTFDDGPSPASPHIARFLASESICATFFQCGANILRHPGMARDLHAAGHEIGNHTFSHARLCPRLGWKTNLLGPESVYSEFARTQEVIGNETGTNPRVLRPPYGLRWFGLRRVQRRLHLKQVMWTVIAHDWEWDGHRAADFVLRNATPGGIVCLHDGRDIRPNPDISSTIEALHRIVPELKRQGFGFETVSSILRKQGEVSESNAI